MSISGNLKTMEFGELLEWLSQGRKSGTLVIDRGPTQKKIYFTEGKICASASNDPSEKLGHFLVGQGLITEMELAKAYDMQESSGMLLGKILVTVGGISQEDLRRAMVLKTSETLYDIFAWSEGEFRFLDGESLESGMIPMALEVPEITLRGQRRQEEWQRIQQIIPSSQAIPVSVGFLDDPELPPVERKILSLVDDDRTVREICLEAHAGEFQVCEVLYRQIERGRLKVVCPRASVAPPSRAPSSTSTEIPNVDVDGLLQIGERHLGQADYERALRYLRAALSLEPNDSKVKARVKEAEEQIQASLRQAGLVEVAVPQLNRSAAELAKLQLSPEEGFILSRINGGYDLQSIMKITPMTQLDAGMVMLKLLKAGHIRMEMPKEA